MSPSRRGWVVLLGGLLLPGAGAQGTPQPQPQPQSAQQQVQALTQAYRVYLTAQAYRDYCVQNDPAGAGHSRQAFSGWAQRQHVTQFEPQLGRLLGAQVFAQFRTQVESQVGNLGAALRKLGPAARVCSVYPNQLNTAALDLQAKVPNLAAILAGKVPTGTAAGSGGPAAGVGTVYSVAQLSTLAGQTLAALPKGTTGTAAEAAVLRKLRSLGAQIAVTGTVAPKYDALDQQDDRRTARWDIYCYDLTQDGALDPLRGKTATVVGTVQDFDRDTSITLDHCQVVTASGLKHSALPVADVGWRFKNQPAEKFLVAAGQGLTDSQILGVYTEQSYTTGVGGVFITTYPPSLFLKDGSVYNDPYWAPDSFNAALSRQLEPQKWGKWTRQGRNFRIVWGDGHTELFEVQSAPAPTPAGQPLSGTYTTISGGGNTALGGDVLVAVSGDYTFTPQGTFKGGRSASGSTSTVTAGSQSSTSGRYALSRYGLTLSYIGGGKQRLFFYQVDKNVLHIGGSDYVQGD